MARLTSPSGVVVNVSDAKAEQLASIGFVAVKDDGKAEAKAPAKLATARKPAAKKSDN